MPTGVVGEFRFVNCAVVGFERDTVKRQPDVVVEMRVLDESGKSVSKPTGKKSTRMCRKTRASSPCRNPSRSLESARQVYH